MRRLKGRGSGRPTFSDLKLDPGQVPDLPRPPEQFILVGLLGPWSMALEFEARVGLKPCPGCDGDPLGRRHYCLRCDRAGVDGRCELPGLPIDAYRDPTWSSEPTKYAPDGTLVGGVGGGKVKLRKGIKRSRARAGQPS